MTWNQAVGQHGPHSPNFQQSLAPISSDRAFRPVNANYAHDPDEMDLDQSPIAQQSGQQTSPETQSRANRTPLPSGPRLEKTAQAVMSLPSIDSFRSQLQNTTSKIISNPNRSRYSAVRALLLYWDNEQLMEVKDVVEELGLVLEKHYHYMFEVNAIPRQNSRGWLLQRLIEFMKDNDHRDVLKIVYYNGHTYLDENRCMTLAGSTEPEEACGIRWNGIQQIFEEASSDTLVIMDAPYFGLPEAIRKCGVLEVLAAGSFEEHASPLARCAFTRALINKLRTQAPRSKPFSAAELHAQLVSEYPRIIQDLTPERTFLTKFPAPLHLQLSGSNNVPSILLAPLRRRCSLPKLESIPSPGTQLSMTFHLDKAPNMERWVDWLRLMPDDVKDIRVEGPFRTTLH
ncbi:hypothetical protein VP1G_02015 [Cytospora mali]|uniref:Uncharacterized protein n=1 Tax=Cytospora mali TaxID=578113 RepID=A0A194USE8_CYTMA|nr:hypothetical protein VP1G_02015 [Valsa mali var. pyri (nom. inval.)]